MPELARAELNRMLVANDYCGSYYTMQQHMADQWTDETKPHPAELRIGSLPTIETGRLHRREEPSESYGLTKGEFLKYQWMNT